MAELPTPPATDPLATLVPREREITELVRQGRLNKQIAASTGLTEGTVKEYMIRIFQKTGAGNRTELAVMAQRQQMAQS